MFVCMLIYVTFPNNPIQASYIMTKLELGEVLSEKENYWLCKFSLFKMQSPSQEKMLLSDKQMYEYRCNYVTFLKWHLLTIVVPSFNLIFSGMLWKKLIERKVNGDSLWRGLSERRGYGFFQGAIFYWISFRVFLPICFILLCGISSHSRFLCLFAPELEL